MVSHSLQLVNFSLGLCYISELKLYSSLFFKLTIYSYTNYNYRVTISDPGPGLDQEVSPSLGLDPALTRTPAPSLAQSPDQSLSPGPSPSPKVVRSQDPNLSQDRNRDQNQDRSQINR